MKVQVLQCVDTIVTVPTPTIAQLEIMPQAAAHASQSPSSSLSAFDDHRLGVIDHAHINVTSTQCATGTATATHCRLYASSQSCSSLATGGYAQMSSQRQNVSPLLPVSTSEHRMGSATPSLSLSSNLTPQINHQASSTMAISNKTIIALALLAIAVAVVAESQGERLRGALHGACDVVCGVSCSALAHRPATASLPTVQLVHSPCLALLCGRPRVSPHPAQAVHPSTQVD